MNEELKQSIDGIIKANGKGEITGPLLNSVLKTMIDALSNGANVKGLATPKTVPGTPDGPVMYFTTQGGVYPSFNNLKVPEGFSLLFNSKGTMGETIWNAIQMIVVDEKVTKDSRNAVTSEAIYFLSRQGYIFAGGAVPQSEGFKKIERPSFVVCRENGVYKNFIGVDGQPIKKENYGLSYLVSVGDTYIPTWELVDIFPIAQVLGDSKETPASQYLVTQSIQKTEGVINLQAQALKVLDERSKNQGDQIETLISRSDVVDVVGKKSELDRYDISKITINDVIKVLRDESKDNAITYYRLTSIDPKEWTFIGGLGEVYTARQVDEKFIPVNEAIAQHTTEIKDLKGKATQTYENFAAIQASGDTNANKIFVDRAEHTSYIYVNGKYEAIGKEIEVDKELSETSTNPVQNKAIVAELDKKTNKDGYYGDFTAGAAENLIGGIDVSQEFYRGVVANGQSIDGKKGRINAINGHSLVMNQKLDPTLYRDVILQGVELTRNGNSILIKATEGETTSSFGNNYSRINAVDGHKYYQSTRYSGTNEGIKSWDFGLLGHNTPVNKGIIFTYTDGKYNRYYYISKPAKITKVDANITPIIVDLTQMYGAGNEPSTPEEFEATFQLPYYDYNEGTIVSFNGTGIKSVGFNQWDEQVNESPTSRVASKNFIPLIQGKTYYRAGHFSYMEYYDANKVLIKTEGQQEGVLHIPKEARFMKFGIETSGYGHKYKNDICINISDPKMNGTYLPYVESTKSLDIASIKDAEGQPLFPNGLQSAGDVHDEVTKDYAIKRVGAYAFTGQENVYNYQYPSTTIKHWWVDGLIKDALSIDGSAKSQLMSNEYLAAPASGGGVLTHVADRTISVCSSSHQYGQVWWRDNRFQDASAVKTYFKKRFDEGNPVIVNYPLRIPIRVDFAEPRNYDFNVENHGTLAVIPEETATPTTAPARLDISYTMDVTGAIKGLPQNYISKESMEGFLGQLSQAMGGTWSMVWDASTGKYKFTFAKAQALDIPPEEEPTV